MKRLRTQSLAHGLEYVETELTNHTGVRIGRTRSTLSRQSEIDDVTVRKFFEQFAPEFGKGWWR